MYVKMGLLSLTSCWVEGARSLAGWWSLNFHRGCQHQRQQQCHFRQEYGVRLMELANRPSRSMYNNISYLLLQDVIVLFAARLQEAFYSTKISPYENRSQWQIVYFWRCFATAGGHPQGLPISISTVILVENTESLQDPRLITIGRASAWKPQLSCVLAVLRYPAHPFN